MTGESPYIGLRYFEERDADLFYGRDEHVAELLAKLASHRFVAVMGSSGCGKSSLVRAGLLPELRTGIISSAGPRWTVVEFKPGRDPLGELAAAMSASLGIENAQQLVEEGPLGIARAAAEAAGNRTNILILADQFEEVFRYQREEAAQGRGPQATERCAALARRLLDAADQTTVPVYVLLVMRSDYLGECAQFPDLPERISESLYLVPRLHRDQLQEAIAAPVGGAIDAPVMQRLLGETGNDPDQLPRLQHLLSRMWDAAAALPLRMQDYTAAGGWEKGLEQHLEQVFRAFNPEQQQVSGRVFAQLSEVDKGRAVRRRADTAELIGVCGPAASGVVDAFRKEGFLLARADPVDITHECILREWPRLQAVLEHEQQNVKRVRQLVDAAKDAGWSTQPGAPYHKNMRGLAGLTLQNLLEWRVEAKPVRAWASRYVKPEEFDAAMEYLEWSEIADRALRIQAEKEARRRGRRNVLLGGAVVLSLVLAGYAYTQRSDAAYEREAERLLSCIDSSAANRCAWEIRDAPYAVKRRLLRSVLAIPGQTESMFGSGGEKIFHLTLALGGSSYNTRASLAKDVVEPYCYFEFDGTPEQLTSRTDACLNAAIELDPDATWIIGHVDLLLAFDKFYLNHLKETHGAGTPPWTYLIFEALLREQAQLDPKTRFRIWADALSGFNPAQYTDLGKLPPALAALDERSRRQCQKILAERIVESINDQTESAALNIMVPVLKQIHPSANLRDAALTRLAELSAKRPDDKPLLDALEYHLEGHESKMQSISIQEAMHLWSSGKPDLEQLVGSLASNPERPNQKLVAQTVAVISSDLSTLLFKFGGRDARVENDFDLLARLAKAFPSEADAIAQTIVTHVERATTWPQFYGRSDSIHYPVQYFGKLIGPVLPDQANNSFERVASILRQQPDFQSHPEFFTRTSRQSATAFRPRLRS